MAGSTELGHFFCLSRLPPPPRTLDAGGRRVPPFTCCSALALSVPPEKGQSSGAWRVHPACGCGRDARLRAGDTLSPVLAERRCECGICAGDVSVSQLFVVRVPRITRASGAAASQPLCRPEPPEVLEGRKRKMAAWLPTLASPPHGAGSRPFQVEDFGVSCPQLRSPGGGVCPEPSCKSIVSGCSSSIPLGARVRDQSLCWYEAELSRCLRPGSRRLQRVRMGLWLSRFQVPSNIYSGAQVWLGAFASKAQEWGYKKENGGEQKNTISGS